MTDPRHAAEALSDDALDHAQGGSDDGWWREVRVTPKPGTSNPVASKKAKKVEVELVWS